MWTRTTRAPSQTLPRRRDRTPLCVTYDFDSETDGCVTVRDRDSMAQVRIPIDELEAYIAERVSY